VILTVVGSGTLVPSARRSTPALCLVEGDLQITVDGGSGTLRRQAELGIDFRRTHTLLFTHVHPDHTLDLLHFLFASSYAPPAPREEPVRLIGPRGFAAFVEAYREGIRSWTRGGEGGIDLREVEDGETVDLPGIRVEAVGQEHAVRDLGYRFTDARGRCAAFTGDTGANPGLVALARDADVFVCECSGDADHPMEGHLTAPEAGRAAAEAGARQLVLSHLYPMPDDRRRVAEAAAHFGGPIHLAEDGDRFIV
jgi:ribonuclease BN (tRNA processing enzyme)